MSDANEVIMLDPRRNQAAERRKLYEEMLLKEMPGTSRPNEPMHAVLESELGEKEIKEGHEAQNVRNHALIHYLATLATSNDNNDTFDFNFVESLLENGADINSKDKTGQTVFHEVARSWNIDVASFLIKHGADANHQDDFGRSPLHVAAAVDYAEMVEFLIQNEADIGIKTLGEEQTPMHFAAKNDAINSLQMLLGYGADIDARDSKNRTPLQVSAEMNRSKAAKLLINEGAPAGVYDNLGNSALSLLIEKIPEVALEAMDQFHSVDTINRKEFYFLNYLEGPKLKEQKTPARTPLEIAVQNERFDIILHPVMQRLIGVKWQMYGKWGAILDLIINLVYSILWTVMAVTLPKRGRDLYLPLKENSWRLTIGVILVLLTVLEIRKQVTNTIKTRQELKKWKEWRAAELERDLQYCHPRWQQETQYLRSEIKGVRNLSLISGSDWWIYFDWVALVFILATIVSHVLFFHYSTSTFKYVHHYIVIPLLIIMWFRIFKYARPFESAGPFVVIFGCVLGDIVKWAFLNLVFIVPFTSAFWITFGPTSLDPVPGYDDVGSLLYHMFSMMVVNDHDYNGLEAASPYMARILCGAFIGLMAIVTLNLLIALLTNTFERLYENAVANAVMQRARTILLMQKTLRRKQKKQYYGFIRKRGSPEVVGNDLGSVFVTERDERATVEKVREDISIILNLLGEQFGKRYGRRKKKSTLDFVKIDVSKVRRYQEELLGDVKNLKGALDEMRDKIEPLLKNYATIVTNTTTSVNNNNDNNNNVVGNATTVATTTAVTATNNHPTSTISTTKPPPGLTKTKDKITTIVGAFKNKSSTLGNKKVIYDKKKKKGENSTDSSDSSDKTHSSDSSDSTPKRKSIKRDKQKSKKGKGKNRKDSHSSGGDDGPGGAIVGMRRKSVQQTTTQLAYPPEDNMAMRPVMTADIYSPPYLTGARGFKYDQGNQVFTGRRAVDDYDRNPQPRLLRRQSVFGELGREQRIPGSYHVPYGVTNEGYQGDSFINDRHDDSHYPTPGHYSIPNRYANGSVIPGDDKPYSRRPAQELRYPQAANNVDQAYDFVGQQREQSKVTGGPSFPYSRNPYDQENSGVPVRAFKTPPTSYPPNVARYGNLAGGRGMASNNARPVTADMGPATATWIEDQQRNALHPGEKRLEGPQIPPALPDAFPNVDHIRNARPTTSRLPSSLVDSANQTDLSHLRDVSSRRQTGGDPVFVNTPTHSATTSASRDAISSFNSDADQFAPIPRIGERPRNTFTSGRVPGGNDAQTVPHATDQKITTILQLPVSSGRVRTPEPGWAMPDNAGQLPAPITHPSYVDAHPVSDSVFLSNDRSQGPVTEGQGDPAQKPGPNTPGSDMTTSRDRPQTPSSRPITRSSIKVQLRPFQAATEARSPNPSRRQPPEWISLPDALVEATDGSGTPVRGLSPFVQSQIRIGDDQESTHMDDVDIYQEVAGTGGDGQSSLDGNEPLVTEM